MVSDRRLWHSLNMFGVNVSQRDLLVVNLLQGEMHVTECVQAHRDLSKQ